MKKPALCALLCLAPALARAEGAALTGPTGLLTAPTAEVLDEGSVRFGASAHDSVPAHDQVVNYLFSIGLLPGLEVGGRAIEKEGFSGASNDLSFNAKLRLWRFDNGLALAVGAEDIGGEAREVRRQYAMATLPWRTLSLTAGYQRGQDLPRGAIGGLEWRPWPFLGVYAEYDTEEVNPGVKLQSPELWGRLRIEANAGYRGATDEVEGGVAFSLPLGRRPLASLGVTPPLDVIPRPLDVIPRPLDVIPRREGAEGSPDGTPRPARDDASPSVSIEQARALQSALEDLGFESVRTGLRPDGTLAVSLENRRYNHSSADGIGLALGTIARHAPARVPRVELTQSAYGVPQVEVATDPAAYRRFLDDNVAPENLLDVRYSAGPEGELRWLGAARYLSAGELVLEPLLRTFFATEYGLLDVGLGARARMSLPMARGLTAHFGLQAPLLLTDDFRDDRNFAGFAPEGGMDLMLIQYAHKVSPAWTWLWSAGRSQVIQTDLTVGALEQAWTSPRGAHRLHAKLMVTDSGLVQREIALAGYTLFDAARGLSVSVSGGRYYVGDSGIRLDLVRHFDDVQAGLFLKGEGRENMAGGFQLSLPLTPRRDRAPRVMQVKGTRRWSQSLQTTLNLADGTNQLKPLLLLEPMLDFDLRRDFLDSGRLGPEYLEEQLPRMREAWELWGGG